jgi:hypothetical protein
LTSVVLPVEVPLGDSSPKRRGLRCGHDAGGDVVVEREHRDGRFSDREGRRYHDRWQQPLKALTGLGQFGGDARASRMRLGPDMVGHEPHDALAIGHGNAPAGVFKSRAQPIDPELAIGVEHHLDDAGVLQVGGDVWPERGPQHPG